MRAFLVVISISFALALAGCGDDGGSGGGPDLSMPVACATSCPVCTTGLTCVTATAGHVAFPAACLKPCHSNLDCQNATCVLIDGANPLGSYCIAAGEPGRCGAGCTMGGTSIHCEGDVQSRAFIGDVCGLERTYCPNACTGAGDGGTDTNPRCL